MTTFAREAVDEAAGASSKKWALVLAALVAGTALGVWLHGRSARDGSEPAEVAPASGAPSADESHQAIRTDLEASTRRVRSELNRWARLPRAGWDVARNVAGEPRQ
jgi:uncharacterized protein HemX